MKSKQYFGILLTASIFLLSCSDSTPVNNDPINEGNDTVPTEREWQLVWSDEFDDNNLDTDKWSYQIGTGQSEGLTAWGNNELQYYTDREENVFIEDGKLHITAHRENYNGMRYTSARLRTLNKGDWQYGRVEVRAKMPEGQGIWPAIWMLPTDNSFGTWPKSGEIDIMELVGHEPETIHGTVHYGPDWPQNQQKTTSVTLDEGTFADEFYTFSIEWKQSEIKWFLDGEHFFTITPNDLSPHNYPFNARFHLLLNLAVGGNWPGNPDETTQFPQTMIVDYVRVYQYL